MDTLGRVRIQMIFNKPNLAGRYFFHYLHFMTTPPHEYPTPNPASKTFPFNLFSFADFF
jgi:hypothetical protein